MRTTLILLPTLMDGQDNNYRESQFSNVVYNRISYQCCWARIVTFFSDDTAPQMGNAAWYVDTASMNAILSDFYLVKERDVCMFL